MRSIRIAEWILELSTTRERAEAVAGDLREAGRGAFWFWRSVLTTMIASVWRDFQAAWLWLFSVSFVLGLANVLIEGAILGVIPHDPMPTFERVNFVLNIVLSLLFSRWIAQCSRGRELASWLASYILGIAVNVILMRTLSFPYHPSFISLVTFLTFLGAVSARVRPRLLSSNPRGVTHA